MEWNEKEIETILQELLESAEDFTYANVQTFREAGVLTSNAGIVLRVRGGIEFQITIVRSK